MIFRTHGFYMFFVVNKISISTFKKTDKKYLAIYQPVGRKSRYKNKKKNI